MRKRRKGDPIETAPRRPTQCSAEDGPHEKTSLQAGEKKRKVTGHQSKGGLPRLSNTSV